MDFINYCD
jgi:hypothetical protein